MILKDDLTLTRNIKASDRFSAGVWRQLRHMLMFLATVYPLAAQPALPPVEPSAPDPGQYLLGPDDQIKVWVLGVEEIGDKPIRIDPAGNIDLPLVGKVKASGLTTEQLKNKLVEKYSSELLKPKISVEIIDYGSQPISVMGAVNHPGVHQVQGHKSLIESISLADGLRPDAGPRVNISRDLKYGAIPLVNAKVDPTGRFSVADVGVKDLLGGLHPAENIQIMPYDVITIPPAEQVFVIGEVKKPGEIPMKGDGVTVLQALSTAEGFGPAPSPGNARIVRVFPGTSERKEIPVDLNKILAGKAEDIPLHPNDILVVPSSVPKKAAARALEAAVQVAVGAAVWGRF